MISRKAALQKLPSSLLCFAAILLATSPMPGAAADPVDQSDDYVVQVWDTDSGLPHSTVTSLAQTPDGYLWVGTLHGGLARFDGTRFVNYDPGNTPELKSIEIHKLLVDASGTLWIGNVEGGLISERDGRFHFEYWNNDTPRAWVEEILSSGPERMDFASRLGMIFRRTGMAGSARWETLTLPDAQPIAMPCEPADGASWYRLRNGQLAQLLGTNAVPLGRLPGPKPTGVNALVKDVLGRPWIGTENGLAVWNGTNFTSQTPANGEDVAVRNLLPCADGGFWVSTPLHLRKFLHGEWVCSFDLSPTNAPADNLAGFALQFTDSRSGVWLWHDQKKLVYVSRAGKMSWLGDAGGKLVGSVRCWLEDHEGNLWLGLNDGGLARLRPRIFHAVWPGAGVDSKAARSVCEDERGVLWFGSGGRQVWRWADGAFANFTPTNTAYFEDTKVCPAGHGDLWVGSVQNGLLRLHQGDFAPPFDPRNIGTVARSLLRDRRGQLWIGSEFGLFRYDEINGLKTFTRADGFTPAYVLSLVEATNGDLWCGTALGELRRLHAGQFTSFRPPDSLTDEATLRTASAADPMGERNRGALSGG
jgi:ligand-binding sensor domain-containing protein